MEKEADLIHETPRGNSRISTANPVKLICIIHTGKLAPSYGANEINPAPVCALTRADLEIMKFHRVRK